MLTSDCSDYTVAIFYQLFEKFARPLQLQFITLESLSEVRTVQIAVTKLQRRMPHLLNNWVLDNRNTELVLLSHAPYAGLSHTAHCCSVEATPHSHLFRGAETMVSVGACGSRWSSLKRSKQRRGSGLIHFPLSLV